jgi:hydrogenase maturation protease
MPGSHHPAGQKKYRALILCCGDMDRADDAIGPLCAAALQDRKIPARTIHGRTSEFLEAFHAAQKVIVVDAIVTGHLPTGALHRMRSTDPWFQPAAARSSAQGLGLAHACRLASALKCLPDPLILLGLEAAWFDWSATQSPAVAAAIPTLVGAVEAEWRLLAGLRPPAPSHRPAPPARPA